MKNATTCLSEKEDFILKQMIDANEDDYIVSDCCGAKYDDDAELCLECNDHCEGILLSDFNGNYNA